MSIKSAPLKAALLPQPPRHGLEPATRNLKPVTCNLFHTHVFENKIAARLPFSNQMDSRQSNLSTTVSKQRLMQCNQILKHRGARPPIFEKNHFELHPEPASPGNQLPATSSEHSASRLPNPQLSISHRSRAAPTVNPAPTLAIKIKSPFFSFPSCRAVSIASGIVAEVVFPEPININDDP
jgi:hypothetical protein